MIIYNIRGKHECECDQRISTSVLRLCCTQVYSIIDFFIKVNLNVGYIELFKAHL
jgi:hypothetical protein